MGHRQSDMTEQLSLTHSLEQIKMKTQHIKIYETQWKQCYKHQHWKTRSQINNKSLQIKVEKEEQTKLKLAEERK